MKDRLTGRPRHKYIMRINEDFLDDEASELGTEDVRTGDKEESAYQYRFIFCTA